MAELKWTGLQIISFLNIFKNYPCLWDCYSSDYLNRSVREATYKSLVEELTSGDIPCTVESVKKKIKSLRDTYRKELHKIAKSKENGATGIEVYKPKLMWFSAAEIFWYGVAAEKETSSNMDLGLQQCLKLELESELSNDTYCAPIYTSEQEASQEEPSQEEPSPEPLQSASTTPTSSRKRRYSERLPTQRAKRLSGNKQQSSRFGSAGNQFHQIERTTTNAEDQYDQFSKHVAAQLRELPLRNFIILQSKIQNLITEERLAVL